MKITLTILLDLLRNHQNELLAYSFLRNSKTRRTIHPATTNSSTAPVTQIFIPAIEFIILFDTSVQKKRLANLFTTAIIENKIILNNTIITTTRLNIFTFHLLSQSSYRNFLKKPKKIFLLNNYLIFQNMYRYLIINTDNVI